MIHKHEIDAQLKRIGLVVKSWGAAEVRELANIMVPGEQIKGLINGWYENGFAMLVATDHRLLLVDKKPLYLAVEDLRYDMISEVDYSAGVLYAQLGINTVNKELDFKSLHHRRLRELTTFVQYEVMLSRRQQHAIARQFDAPTAVADPSIEWLPQAAANMRLVNADGPLATITPVYPQSSLTTKHHFLPKVRRRRPINLL